jgi:hypothetical protein
VIRRLACKLLGHRGDTAELRWTSMAALGPKAGIIYEARQCERCASLYWAEMAAARRLA